MQLPVLGVLVVAGRAVPAHGVREAPPVQVVVLREQASEELGQAAALVVVQVREARDVPARHHEGLERPEGPERHDRHPPVVLDDHPGLEAQLETGVVEQQRAARRLERGSLPLVLDRGLVGEMSAGPQLAVRVRVGRPHVLAAVLEHEHGAVSPAELGDLLDPQTDHLLDLRCRHQREIEVVPGGEAQDPAGAGPGPNLQERALLGRGLGRVRTQGGEVVDEREGPFVRGVPLASRPLVAGTQVAARVVSGPWRRVRRLRPAEPRAGRAARRHQYPSPVQRVQPPVGRARRVDGVVSRRSE